MLRILSIVVILFVGIIFGPVIADQHGIVVFELAKYRISMSVGVFILALCLFYFVFYVFLTLLSYLANIRFTLKGKKYRYLLKNAKNINQAYLALIEGEANKSIKLLTKAANNDDLNNTALFLQAAQIEIDHSNYKEALDLLKKAANSCTKKELLAYKLVQLRLFIASQKHDLAADLLDKLMSEYSKNAMVILLAFEFYKSTNNADAIIKLLPILSRAKLISNEQYDAVLNDSCEAKIEQIATEKSLDALDKWWKDQPRTLRKNKIITQKVKNKLNATQIIIKQSNDEVEIITEENT